MGTPGVEVAAGYVLDQVEAIASLANIHPNLEVLVDREETSGSLDAEFAGVKVASAYNNLTNILLYISPKTQQGATMKPALLLNSHFDSVFGTHGKFHLPKEHVHSRVDNTFAHISCFSAVQHVWSDPIIIYTCKVYNVRYQEADHTLQLSARSFFELHS